MKYTQITPINRLCPQITGSNINYITARATPKLMSIPLNKAIMHLLMIINRAFAELDKVPPGTNITERTRYLESMAKMILNDLALYFPLVTINEVDEAVKRGIRGQFGQYYNFNVITVHNFVEKYMTCDERLSIIDQQNKYLLAQQTDEEMPVQNQWMWMKNGLLNCYSSFCQTGRITDYGSVNYQMLVDGGVINLTNDEKLEIYEKAKDQLSRESITNQPPSMWLWLQAKRTGDNKIDLVRISKEIALKNYFSTKPDLNLIMDRLYDTFMASKAKKSET